MASKVKNAIIFLTIGAIMIAGYVFFVKGSGDKPVLIVAPGSEVAPVSSGTDEASSVVREFLPVLLNVKSIRLEDAIFSDDAFKSLHDSSILLIPDGTEGRPNPFAPIGVDSFALPASVAPVTVPTVPPANPTKGTTTNQ